MSPVAPAWLTVDLGNSRAKLRFHGGAPLPGRLGAPPPGRSSAPLPGRPVGAVAVAWTVAVPRAKSAAGAIALVARFEPDRYATVASLMDTFGARETLGGLRIHEPMPRMVAVSPTDVGSQVVH